MTPFGGVVQSSASIQEAVIGLSGAEVAARALALRDAGLLPASLAAMIDDSGAVVYRDQTSGDLLRVRADFFTDFRPYVASVSVPVSPARPAGTYTQAPVALPIPAPSLTTPLPAGVGSSKAPAAIPRFAVSPQFAPIITGEPISTGVFLVISLIGSLFGGLFSGGVSSAVKRALEGLRHVVSETADRLLRFAWLIGNTLGRVMRAFVNVWVRVLRPMLDALGKIIREVERIYDKVLRPALRIIRRIREQILYWYERIVRPVLQAIQVIRTVIYIFRVAGFKWAQELDEKLVRLQAAIMRPLWFALEKLNLVSAWINVIMSVEGLLRGNVLFNSIDQVSGRLARLLWWNGRVTVDSLREQQLTHNPANWGVPQAAAAVREYSSSGGGRLAGPAAAGEARLRSLMGG